MQSISLGSSATSVSRLAYGCWRILGPEGAVVDAGREAAGYKAVQVAYEAGFTFFDLADVYADGAAERVFGRVLKETAGMRKGVVITTKCGIRRRGTPKPDSPYRYDFSAEYIVQCCEQSLQRLGLETIDVFQLHRPDYLMEPAEVVAAFASAGLTDRLRLLDRGEALTLPFP